METSPQKSYKVEALFFSKNSTDQIFVISWYDFFSKRKIKINLKLLINAPAKESSLFKKGFDADLTRD